VAAATAGAVAAARTPKGRAATATAKRAVSRAVDQAKEAVSSAVSDMGGKVSSGAPGTDYGTSGNGGTNTGGGSEF
jgi:hypothetical protein